MLGFMLNSGPSVLVCFDLELCMTQTPRIFTKLSWLLKLVWGSHSIRLRSPSQPAHSSPFLFLGQAKGASVIRLFGFFLVVVLLSCVFRQSSRYSDLIF